jgi:hypothetical protein
MITSKGRSSELLFLQFTAECWRSEKKWFGKPIPLCIYAAFLGRAVLIGMHKSTNAFPRAPCTKCENSNRSGFPNSHVPDHAMHRLRARQKRIETLLVMLFSFLVILQYVYPDGKMASKLTRSAFGCRPGLGYDISPSSSSSSSSSSSRLSIASLMNCAA